MGEKCAHAASGMKLPSQLVPLELIEEAHGMYGCANAYATDTCFFCGEPMTDEDKEV